MNDEKKQGKFTKKNALIEAAIMEFSTKSFEQASLNRILKQASVSKGVFYHHFTSKDELYLHVVGLLFNKKKIFISEHMTEVDVKGDIFHLLKTSISLGLEFAKQNPDAGNFTTMLMKERGSDIYKKVMSQYNINSDLYVKQLIENAIANGNIREDFSEEFVTRIITYFLEHINEIMDTKGIGDYEKKIEDLISFLEYGLRMN